MIPLGNIADVFMGATFRGRDATRAAPGGSCQLIRISDLSDEGRLIQTDLHRFEPVEALKDELFLRPGDVLFPNRGTRTTAYVFDLPEGNVLVGGQFYVIRLRSREVLPEYVAWYFRSDEAAQYFHLQRKGTLVQTLQRRDIEQIPIPLPALNKQRAIIALDSLGTDDRHLSVELANLRATYLQRQLLNAVSQL